MYLEHGLAFNFALCSLVLVLVKYLLDAGLPNLCGISLLERLIAWDFAHQLVGIALHRRNPTRYELYEVFWAFLVLFGLDDAQHLDFPVVTSSPASNSGTAASRIYKHG